MSLYTNDEFVEWCKNMGTSKKKELIREVIRCEILIFQWSFDHSNEKSIKIIKSYVLDLIK